MTNLQAGRRRAGPQALLAPLAADPVRDYRLFHPGSGIRLYNPSHCQLEPMPRRWSHGRATGVSEFVLSQVVHGR